MTDSSNILLKTTKLEIGFRSGKQQTSLLSGIDLNAGRGELIALIGRNGSGKSTLLRTIMRLQPLLSGQIELNSRGISTYSRREFAMQTAFVSTEAILTANISVFELVSLGRFPYTNWIGSVKDSDRQLIDSSIKKVGLCELRHKMLSEISDGERQRAMIARALAQDSDLLVLDEPTAFLDLPNKYEVIALLKELASQGKTVIFSTHDLNMVIDQVDKIWLMTPQSLIDATPEEHIQNNSFDKVFPGSSLRFDRDKGQFLPTIPNR